MLMSMLRKSPWSVVMMPLGLRVIKITPRPTEYRSATELVHATLLQKISLFDHASHRAVRNVRIRHCMGAPGPGLARPAQGRAGLRQWPPGSGVRARRRALSAPLSTLSHRDGGRVCKGRTLQP